MKHPAIYLLLFLALGACDSDSLGGDGFSPFDETDTFSVFAILDARESSHILRMRALQRESDRGIPLSIANLSLPTVALVDQVTGDSIRFVRSSGILVDGSFGGLYRGSFQLERGREYTLALTRPDGRTASGTALVPNGETPAVEEPAAVVDDSVRQILRWPNYGFLRDASVLVEYTLSPDQPAAASEEIEVVPGLDDTAGPFVTLDYTSYSAAIREARGLDGDAPIYLVSVQAQVEGTSPGWSPSYGSPTLAAQNTNLEGAVGRFGFVDGSVVSVLPSESLLRQAGFEPLP